MAYFLSLTLVFSPLSHVERLLNRISNGVLAEDRYEAVTELQSLVAESHSAQLAVRATGCAPFLSFKKNLYHVSLLVQ